MKENEGKPNQFREAVKDTIQTVAKYALVIGILGFLAQIIGSNKFRQG